MFRAADIMVLEALRHIVGVSKVTDWLIYFAAEYLPYLMAAALLYFIFRSPGRKIYFLALAALGSILSRGILTELIHFLFFRARPFVSLSFNTLISQSPLEGSFPSGHMALLVPLGLTLWQFDRKKGAWFLALTLIVGIARIIAGVHYPLDIIGGILIGFVSFISVLPLLKRAAS